VPSSRLVEGAAFDCRQFLTLCRRQIARTDHLNRTLRILAVATFRAFAPALLIAFRRAVAVAVAVSAAEAENLEDDDRGLFVGGVLRRPGLLGRARRISCLGQAADIRRFVGI
jgi:hypothetical protein